MLDSRRITGGALLLLPAGLMAYFAFNSGGFYPGATAYVAVVLCLVLAVRVVGATDPLEGVGWPLLVAAGALTLYTLWTLLSERWSHAPGLAVVEYDRALVYLLVLVLFGSVARTRLRLAWVVRALAIAIAVVCLCGLITRLLPHLWPTPTNIDNERLSFPVSYWNALGLLAAFGVLLCVHLSSDEREPRPFRIAGAVAVPILATALYFTFSRGPIGVCLIGLVAYMLIGRPRALLSAVLALLPTTVIALKVAYDADLLATANRTSASAIAQGRHVAIAVLACAAAAGVLRWLLAVYLDPRLLRLRLPRHHRQRVVTLGWGTLAVAVVIAVVASSGTLAHQYHRFLNPADPVKGADLRTRLTDPSNDARLPMWRIAAHQYQAAPVKGAGAGTYADTYAQRNRTVVSVQDAHSLYLETLDELGVVGMVLLGVTLIGMLLAAAGRARGPNRAVYALVVAILLSWAIEAAVDWVWEMPVVTVVVFALGGFVLATARPEAEPSSQPRRPLAPAVRTAAGIGCLLLAVLPAFVWASQRNLNRATAAFSSGDCTTATDAALSSISTLGIRAEPYEVVAYCDVQRDLPTLAIGSISRAVSLDRNNWNYAYGLALMQAAAGYDPRPELRRALTLKPEEMLVQQAWHTFTTDTPAQWESDGKAIADSFSNL